MTLNLSSKLVCDSNSETNFPHKLLLTDRQVSRVPKAFTSSSSANIKVSKNRFSKIVRSGGFLGICIGPLLKTGLLLKKKVLRSLAKSALVPLGLTTAALEANRNT